jgi:hypothetical protein
VHVFVSHLFVVKDLPLIHSFIFMFWYRLARAFSAKKQVKMVDLFVFVVFEWYSNSGSFLRAGEGGKLGCSVQSLPNQIFPVSNSMVFYGVLSSYFSD